MLVRTLKILALAFCLLPLALCLLSLPACKKPTEPKAALPDTTSHDFAFEIDTLGADAFGYPSHLKDVAIVDESNVWVVGQIFLKDDSGRADPILYNAAHWDGNRWQIMRALFPICGTTAFAPFAAETVFAFGANEVWVCSGGPIARWMGRSFATTMCVPTDIRQGSIIKLWGTSPKSVYAVGYIGTIIHYNGSTWQKVESGTDIDLVDIWGTGDDDIWIAGLDLATGQRSVLLHYDGVSMRKAYEYVPPYPGLKPDRLTGIVNSVWTSSKEHLWVSDGSTVFFCPANTNGEGMLSWNRTYIIGFLERIRGSASNNIFVVGYFNTIAHFNGATWRYYDTLSDFQVHSRLQSLAVSERSVFAVGNLPGRAMVLRGTRP